MIAMASIAAHVSKAEGYGCDFLHEHSVINIMLQVTVISYVDVKPFTSACICSVLDWTAYERFNRAAPVNYDGDHTTSM